MACNMTWREAIGKTGAYLDAKGVPDATLAAELLAARLLKVGRSLLVPRLGETVCDAHVAALRRAMARLAKGEPIQYVLGEWDFRTLTLGCDRRALIPRPETEELVTRVLKFLNASQSRPLQNLPMQTGGPRSVAAADGTETVPPEDSSSQTLSPYPLVVDVGTGTGAIILSLAREFKGRAAFLGTDVSEDAIALARENAARCGLSDRVRFAVADGLDDFDEPECIDVIVSNPPYVATSVCATLDPRVRDYEPRLALDGGAEGLDFYDRYLADALNLLKPGGAVFFEIGADQGEALRARMAEYGFRDIAIESDFAGHDRYASGRL